MANHNYSGPRHPPDDDRTSWRPDDDENHSEPGRDHQLATDRRGQGQSGYSAGRRGDDVSQRYQNRNPTSQPGSFDERSATGAGMGLDDRFSGRGGGGWERDTGYSHPRNGTGGSASTGVVRGMGGHRGKGPQNWQRSDERIREAVNEALTDHDCVDATHIEVTVSEGEVTLVGTVDDRAMKRLAEDCVEQISGVREVQNHLRIQRHDAPMPVAPGDRKPRA
jgi:hypothetical protein